MKKRQVLLEIVLVFAVFCLQGAVPVPDSNEAHYLSKAIHCWNPHWVGHDLFLDSQTAHNVFYLTFGWLSLVLPQAAFAWVGRVLSWVLMACAWQRLNVAVLPRRWWSILTAAMLVALNHYYNFAGEWLVGGLEAKGFAYAFVFLGLERLVRSQWNPALLFFGAASLFHVLVGGWAAVAAGLAWLVMPKDRPRLVTLWPGLLGGLLIALPSLLPALALTWGIERDVVQQADYLYVFQRLPHHLIPSSYVARFLVMVALWLTLCSVAPPERPLRRLQAFVVGALAIAAVGAILAGVAAFHPMAVVGLLRFYWFRLADVAVPMGIALGAASLTAWYLRTQPCLGTAWLLAAVILSGLYLRDCALDRYIQDVPRGVRMPDYQAWHEVCEWIAQPENIPPGARFLTPPQCQTFKWYTGHSEVVTWKDIPQDARSIVEWWSRIQDVHGVPNPGTEDPLGSWHAWLVGLDPQRLRELGHKYQAEYLLTAVGRRLNLPVVHENRSYIVYRLTRPDVP